MGFGGKGRKGGNRGGFNPMMLMNMLGGGGFGGGGRRKGGGKGGRKGNRNKTPYSELSDEKKAEIREKHDARAADEGRSEVGNATHVGVVVNRQRRYAWVKPLNPGKLPGDVQRQMK